MILFSYILKYIFRFIWLFSLLFEEIIFRDFSRSGSFFPFRKPAFRQRALLRPALQHENKIIIKIRPRCWSLLPRIFPVEAATNSTSLISFCEHTFFAFTAWQTRSFDFCLRSAIFATLRTFTFFPKNPQSSHCFNGKILYVNQLQ